MVCNANDAAPGAFADQGPKPGFAKIVREDITIRGRGFVDETDLVAMKHGSRICSGHIAGIIKPRPQQSGIQSFDNPLGHIAAAVGAYIDNEASLADLGIVPFYELVDTR